MKPESGSLDSVAIKKTLIQCPLLLNHYNKRLCLLVVTGVIEEGNKKLLAIEGGYRKSQESWKLVFQSLIERGLKPPLLIIGDGALGLWSGLRDREKFKDVKEQRCWVHKIANVLNQLPKRLHAQVKSLLHDMMQANSQRSAGASLRVFEKALGHKYPRAVESIKKDWEELISFFSFPAEHWQHIRSTNPIESAFAKVETKNKKYERSWK